MTRKTKVLRFTQQTWNRPIVCNLASEYGLSFNIVKAFILPRQEGRMVIELIGEEKDCLRGIEYLQQSGVIVEPIEKGITKDESACVHCGACTGLCPTQALYMDRPDMIVKFDPALCVACGWCTKGCPTQAMQLTVNDVS